MPKRSSPKKLRRRSRRRIQCARCASSYSYSGARSHVCKENSTDDNILIRDHDDGEQALDSGEETSLNYTNESDGEDSSSSKEDNTESEPLLSADLRRRLSDRLRKRFNEEDLDYFEDDVDNMSDNTDCDSAGDSVNEDWSGSEENSDPEEDFDQPQASKQAGENVDDNNAQPLSDKCRVLVFWLVYREVPVNSLNTCDWTVNNNVCITSAVKDETLDSDDLNALQSVYRELLGLDERTSIEMPFTIAEFKSIKVGSILYGSLQSQTARNSFILASWAGPEGSLACSTGHDDDVRPGQVLTLFRHSIKVKSSEPEFTDQRYEFYMARVNWYSVHPERFSFGAPVEIWCNTFDVFGPACFIPVQRFISRCSLGETIYNRETVLGVIS